MKRPRLGDIVEVRFLDHIQRSRGSGLGDLLPCVAYGRISKITKGSLHLITWEALELGVLGTDRYVLARKDITGIRRLK